jgi:hypothetical protein
MGTADARRAARGSPLGGCSCGRRGAVWLGRDSPRGRSTVLPRVDTGLKFRTNGTGRGGREIGGLRWAGSGPDRSAGAFPRSGSSPHLPVNSCHENSSMNTVFYDSITAHKCRVSSITYKLVYGK